MAGGGVARKLDVSISTTQMLLPNSAWLLVLYSLLVYCSSINHMATMEDIQLIAIIVNLEPFDCTLSRHSVSTNTTQWRRHEVGLCGYKWYDASWLSDDRFYYDILDQPVAADYNYNLIYTFDAGGHLLDLW